MKKMKRTYLTVLLATVACFSGYSQTEPSNSVSEQIKNERDAQIKELRDLLRNNEDEVRRLTEILAASDSKKTQDKERIANLEQLQLALDTRIRILEDAPTAKINLNGQLAFTELLSIQRDIQPADLFIKSKAFFNQLGNIGSLQQYNSFTSWKLEFDRWYSSQRGKDPITELVNNSLSLITNPAGSIPLFGSFVQSVFSGVISIFPSFGSRNRPLSNQTPAMLRLLTALSQFENQKAIIDHEWKLINQELEQLQAENTKLLEEQMEYYGIRMEDYRSRYLVATLNIQRENFMNECRRIISNKLMQLDSDPLTKGKWLGQVETFMFKVQSLRLRFGHLTNRMLSNINRYENLISVYSNQSLFPTEFTIKVSALGNFLKAVRDTFSASFNPAKYIEDSAVMYIER